MLSVDGESLDSKVSSFLVLRPTSSDSPKPFYPSTSAILEQFRISSLCTAIPRLRVFPNWAPPLPPNGSASGQRDIVQHLHTPFSLIVFLMKPVLSTTFLQKVQSNRSSSPSRRKRKHVNSLGGCGMRFVMQLMFLRYHNTPLPVPKAPCSIF